MTEEGNPLPKNPLSLNLSRVNNNQNGRPLNPSSSSSNKAKPDNAPVRLGAAADATQSKRRKKRKCEDLLRSLNMDIPIPKFDFELEQLQRDFFDDSTPETDSDSHGTARTHSSAQVDASSHKYARDVQSSRVPKVNRAGSDASAPKKQRSSPSLASDHCSPINAPINPLTRPGPDQLLAVIESFLDRADPHSATVNQCFQSLEKQFAITLQKDEKTWARQELSRILTEKQAAIHSQSQQESNTSTAKSPMPCHTETNVVMQQSAKATEVKTLGGSSSVPLPPVQLEKPNSSVASKPPATEAVKKGKPASKPSRRTVVKPQRPSESVADASGKDDKSHGGYAIPKKPAPELLNSSKPGPEQQQTQQPCSPGVDRAKRDHAASRGKAVVERQTSMATKPPAGEDKSSSAQEIILLNDGDDSSQDSVLAVSRSLPPAPVASKPEMAKVSRVSEKIPKPAAKRVKRKTQGGRCQLCIHCPCTFASVFESTRTVSGGASSDEAVERALIRQLQTMEKNAEKYEDQIDTLRRRLKRHRKEMWQRMTREDEASAVPKLQQRSRYLPDTTEMDELLQNGRPTSRMPSSNVNKSTKALFSFAPTFQPTLTQMLGKSDASDDRPTDGTTLSAIPEETEDDLLNDGGDREPAINVEADNQSDEQAILENEVEWNVAEVDVETHRLEYGKSVDDGPTCDGIMGGLANGYVCQWDGLFDDSNDDLGLEELCDMLDDNGPAEQLAQDVVEEDGADGPVDAAMLSQRGKHVLNEIVETFASDSDRVSSLQQTCPNWRENVCFVLRSHEPSDLADALESIRVAKAKLQRKREAILEAATRRANTLELYELALTKSLARLNETPPGDDANADIDELDAHDGFYTKPSASVIY